MSWMKGFKNHLAKITEWLRREAKPTSCLDRAEIKSRIEAVHQHRRVARKPAKSA